MDRNSKGQRKLEDDKLIAEHFSLPWKDSLELWNRIGRPLEVSLDLQALGTA